MLRLRVRLVIFACVLPSLGRFGMAQAKAAMQTVVTDAEDRCGVWAGVIDEDHVLDIKHSFSELKHLFCQNTKITDSAEQAHQEMLNFGVTIPIEGIPVPFNINGNTSDNDKSYHEFWQEL